MISLYKYFSGKASAFFDWIGRNNLAMALIIIMAHLLVKTINLGDASLWYDEAYSIFHSQKTVGEIIDNAKVDTNPPFYNIILKYWMMIFGMSEMAVRYLSVIFSSLAGVAIFFFCKKHLNIQSAFFASVLFLASNVHLFYAHEARSYALTILLSVLSFYFFLNLLKKPSKRSLIALGIVNAFILYTHFITAFLFVAEFIAALLLIKQSKRGFIFYFLSQLFAIVLFIPWVSVLINVYQQTTKSFWLTKPSWKELVEVFNEFAMGQDLLIFYVFLIVVSFISILIFKRKKLNYLLWANIVILALWGFLPIFLNYYIASIIPVFLLRYILYASVGLIVFVSYLLSLAPIGIFPKLLLFIPLSLILFQRIDYTPAKSQDVKGIIPFIESEKDSNSLVILTSIDIVFSYYYNREYFTDYYTTTTRLVQDNIIMLNDTNGIRKVDFNSYQKVILVQSFEKYTDPSGYLFSYLNSTLSLKMQIKDYAGLTVSVFINEDRKLADRVGNKKRKTHTFSTQYITPETPEGTGGWENLVTLTDEKSFTGKYSSKVDKKSPFSIVLRKDLKGYHLRQTSLLQFSCQLFPEKKGNDIKLIIAFHNDDDEIVSWQERTIKSYPLKVKQWNKLVFDCMYPITTYGISYFKAFVWDINAEGITYIDDIEIKIVE